ncbi:hypothetical protein BgiMline_030140 [Biomphalaria glabrata]|nr:hypothetical protein BgiMline_033190 [Biomphalaria glabrata]
MITFPVKYLKVVKKQTEGISLTRICWILILALCVWMPTSNDYFSERRIVSEPFFNVLNPEGTIDLFVSTSVIDNSKRNPMVCTSVSEQHLAQEISRIGCTFTDNLVDTALPEKCAIALDESGLFGSVVCNAIHKTAKQTGSVLCTSVYSQHSLVVFVECTKIGMTLQHIGLTFCETVYDEAGQKMIAVCTSIAKVFRLANSFICITVFDHDLQKSYKLCRLVGDNIQEAKSVTCAVVSKINGNGIGIVCQLILQLKAKVQELSCFILYDPVHNTGSLHCSDFKPGFIPTDLLNCIILEENIHKTGSIVCINTYLSSKGVGTSVCLHAFNQDSITGSQVCTEIINIIKQSEAIECKRQGKDFQESVSCKTLYDLKDASEKMECNFLLSIKSLKGSVSCEMQKKELEKPVEPAKADESPKPEDNVIAIYREEEEQTGFFGLFSFIGSIIEKGFSSFVKDQLYDLVRNRLGMSDKVIQCIHSVWKVVYTFNVFALYELVEKCVLNLSHNLLT